MHAYLIMAHNNFSILEKLIRMLDDVRNDIYIHIDQKAHYTQHEELKKLCKHAGIWFVDSLDVQWGAYSQVECELRLLKKALHKKYDYIHLLSGCCMPIQTQEAIHAFFEREAGKEFIYFENAAPTEKVLERVRYYHFFPGRRNLFNRAMTKFETVLQRSIGVDRIDCKRIQKGANWFSITGTFAEFLVSKESEIRKQFRHTISGDEFFVQTVLINSPFRDNLYCNRFDDSNEQNMRYIDWKRGNPYTFTESDFDEIMQSGCLFVRKLTEENKLPDMIYEKVVH